MKVENTNANHIIQKQTENAVPVERNPRPAENERSEYTNGKDQASLSEEARLLAKTRVDFEDSPDIRTDKVTELREQISSGNYQVPVEQLADVFMKGLKSA